jgi:hypothetical protein
MRLFPAPVWMTIRIDRDDSLCSGRNDGLL